MNTFCLVKSAKLHTTGRNGEPSKILENRVRRRKDFILKAMKMNNAYEHWLNGTGEICLVLTNVPVSEKFSEKLFWSDWYDSDTRKPCSVLPKDWKRKTVNLETVQAMESIR